MIQVSHYVVQWFGNRYHFSDCGGDWGWFVVDFGWTFLSRPRRSIFNVWREFSCPRDAKFCDEYASIGFVLITSL